ncbi:hypothetical protein [Deinococcus sp. 6GRE01]|uniref:hypothetical protein n=1 Tax=Deinococcus sp. 6GRE01 TaxID=2745873 RepID=UPI001E5656D4|nr:hypothetical protein [Deinococcus sp. 6GRE01]MCD0158222.1 hypothetical protein [Deinococcus sp. 6GRE01]
MSGTEPQLPGIQDEPKNIDFPQDQILTTVFVHSSGDDTSRPGEYAVENALKKARVLLAKMKSIEAG